MTNYLGGVNLDTLDMSTVHAVLLSHPVLGYVHHMYVCEHCSLPHASWSGIEGVPDDNPLQLIDARPKFTKEWFFAFWSDATLTLSREETKHVSLHILRKDKREMWISKDRWEEAFDRPLPWHMIRFIRHLIHNGFEHLPIDEYRPSADVIQFHDHKGKPH